MIITFKVKYRRRFWFFRTLVIIGSRYERDQDKFIAVFEDGTIEEIPFWSKCHIKLGKDFAEAQKKAAEKQAAAQPIPIHR